MGAAKPAKRFDPKFRPVDGTDDWTVLKNRDPNRHYVGALASNKGMFDVEYYASLSEGLDLNPEDGYVVEKYAGPQGVRFRTGNTSRAVGDTIMFRGHVLMSCPKEFKELLDQIGPDGSSGLRQADEIDQRLIKRGTAHDPSVNVKSRDGATYIRPFTPSQQEQE